MADLLTDEWLAEVQAAAGAATPGPWRDDGIANDCCPECGCEIEDNAGIVRSPGGGGVCAVLVDDNDAANAKFIALARTAVPLLLQEVRELRGAYVSRSTAAKQLGAENVRLRDELQVAHACFCRNYLGSVCEADKLRAEVERLKGELARVVLATEGE